MEGRYDESTKTINFAGTTIDPMTGKEMKVRETFQLIDDNTQVIVMYMMHYLPQHKFLIDTGRI